MSWGLSHRASLGDIATALGLCVYALLPLRPGLILAASGATLLLMCVRALPGDRQFSRAARAIVGALSLYAALAGSWYIWPAYLLVPIIVAVAIGIPAGFGREFPAAASRGRLGRSEWTLIGLIAIVAAVALVSWAVVLQPDLHRQRAMLPQWPMFGLLAAGLGFSVVNAILEEFIWRGLLLRWFRTFASPAVAVVAQAASFGAAHYQGFPSGFVGAGLAGVYGILLGALALRAGGLLAPIIAHIAADAVIFAWLAGNLN